MGVITFFAYLPAAIHRAFGYDESITVANFVRTRDLWTPLTKQVVFNNQPAISMADHLIYLSTGNSSEFAMRLVPLVCAATCVALVTGAVAQRTSVLPGLVAGTALMVCPLFIGDAWQARAYSLLAVCAVASTLTLRGAVSGTTLSRCIYGALIALGISGQLYMLFVVGGHLVYIYARKELNRPFIVTCAVSSALGLFVYAAIARRMLAAERMRGRLFQPSFPLHLARTLLGENLVIVFVIGLLVLIGIAPLFRQHRREAIILTGYSLIVVAFLWLDAPYDLYARFFIFAAPAVAFALGLGVARLDLHQPWSAIGAAAVMSALLISAISPLRLVTTKDEVPTRLAAATLQAFQSRGLTVCGYGAGTSNPLAAYVRGVTYSYEPRPNQCPIFMVIGRVDGSMLSSLSNEYPYHRTLGSQFGGMLFWRDQAQASS